MLHAAQPDLEPTQPTLVLCELERTGLPDLESYSPFCVKVHRALRVMGLRYSSRHAGDPRKHGDVNPLRQVPVLLIDGRPVADSTDILAALVELRPDALERSNHAEALLWEELADTGLNGFLVASRWADERNWPAVHAAFFAGAPWPVQRIVAPLARRQVVARLVARDVWRAGAEACWRRFTVLLDALDQRAPTDGYWLGDRLGLADLALFAQLHGMRSPLTPWQAAQVQARPRLRAWLDRVDLATR